MVWNLTVAHGVVTLQGGLDRREAGVGVSDGNEASGGTPGAAQ